MNLPSFGRVERTQGQFVLARLPRARVGDGVRILPPQRPAFSGLVTQVGEAHVTIAPFGSLDGIAAGDPVSRDGSALATVLGYGLLGRAVNGRGEPLDDAGPIEGNRAEIRPAGVSPGRRAAIDRVFWTGVRAIDALLTIGRGARVGIFGPPGTGKTTLLEQIVGWTLADAVVVALVGERGCEAASWLSRRDRRTTIVCATSDRCAAERIRAAQTAMSQAVTLRDRGLHVLLVLDSLARFAQAMREHRTALGEPLGRGGYPASTSSEMAALLEAAGCTHSGSITVVASVLSEGEEHDPVSEAARALLDGHILLSLERAHGGRFPAISVLHSTSRTMNAVVEFEQREAAQTVRSALAILEDSREARRLGLARGTEPFLDVALGAQTAIEAFLAQSAPSRPEDTLRTLRNLSEILRCA